MCLRCRADEPSPVIQHMVLIRKGRVEKQSVHSTNRIQCSINITHLLILSCCVCLHMLRAMWTSSVWTILCCFCQCNGELKSGELSEQSRQCWNLFVFGWKMYKTRKVCDWKAAVVTIWKQRAALHLSVCLKEISSNFDKLWEVKRCLMQCGKVQCWPLDWMSAWLHSHEQRLP